MSGESWIVNVTLEINATNDDEQEEIEGDHGLHLVAVVALVLVAACGTIGNVLIIGAVTFKKPLRKRSNVFVVNLAIADLIICAYIMPLGLVTSQIKELTFNNIFCNINGFVVTTCCGVSIQTMALIAIERYFHICRISRYRKLFTPNRVAIVIVSIWIYMCLWSVQGFTGWTRFKYSAHAHLCLLDLTYSISYNISLVLFAIIAPFIIIAFAYLSIFRLVYKNRKVMLNHKTSCRSSHKPTYDYYVTKRQKRKDKKELNVAFMLLTIIVLFVLFWSPVAFVVIADRFIAIATVVYTIATWMALSNSALNSLVYGILNRNFRKGYVTFINKLCRRRRDEDRVDWELSNIGQQGHTFTQRSASHASFRFTHSPPSTSFGIWADTCHSRLSDKSSPKYGMFLDVPSPVKKNISRPNKIDKNDKELCNGDLNATDVSNPLLPKIQVQICTPSDDVSPQSEGSNPPTDGVSSPVTGCDTSPYHLHPQRATYGSQMEGPCLHKPVHVLQQDQLVPQRS